MDDQRTVDPWAADEIDRTNSHLSPGQRAVIRVLMNEYLDGGLTLPELLDAVDIVLHGDELQNELPF